MSASSLRIGALALVATASLSATASANLAKLTSKPLSKQMLMSSEYRCDDLYLLRNAHYALAGYCFKSERGKVHIGNAGCYIHDISKVKLSYAAERKISLIRSVERAKGCSLEN